MVSNYLLFSQKLREKNAGKVVIFKENTGLGKLDIKFKYWIIC